MRNADNNERRLKGEAFEHSPYGTIALRLAQADARLAVVQELDAGGFQSLLNGDHIRRSPGYRPRASTLHAADRVDVQPTVARCFLQHRPLPPLQPWPLKRGSRSRILPVRISRSVRKTNAFESSGPQAERVNDLWTANEKRLMATYATSSASALAGLRIILREIDVEDDPLTTALLKGTITGLEREVARG